MINNPYQGMLGAFQPPMINRGMFGNVSYPQFNMGYNPYQGYNPFAYSSPYMMNPYQGMFNQVIQKPALTPDGREDFINRNTPYQPNAFMRNLAYGLYNMPASPIANFFGRGMLMGDNKASLASVTGDNFRSDGPTGGQAGRDAGGYGDFSGRDSDGWGE